MKTFLSVLLALVLVTAVLVPAASAWRGGCFGCGFGLGFFSGAVVGSVLAHPYYYVPYPYPYDPYSVVPPAYPAPPPACSTQSAQWQQVPLARSGGFTTYQNVWVPPQTVCQ